MRCLVGDALHTHEVRRRAYRLAGLHGGTGGEGVRCELRPFDSLIASDDAQEWVGTSN